MWCLIFNLQMWSRSLPILSQREVTNFSAIYVVILILRWRRIGYQWYVTLNLDNFSVGSIATMLFSEPVGKTYLCWFTLLFLCSTDVTTAMVVYFAVHCRWWAISRLAIKSKFQSLRSVTPPINRNRNSPLPFNSEKEEKSSLGSRFHPRGCSVSHKTEHFTVRFC